MNESPPALPAKIDTVAHFDELLGLYTDAFLDGELFRYVFPIQVFDAADRRRRVEWLARRLLRLRHMQGVCLFGLFAAAELADPNTQARSGDRLAAAAWWFAPEQTPWPGLLRQLRVGLLMAPFYIGPGPLRRLLNFSNHADGIMRTALRRPHRVLDIIAVRPEFQGRGLGRRLVLPALASARDRGEDCFVITHDTRNVAFYESCGFRLVLEDPVPGDPLAGDARPIAYGLHIRNG